MKRWPQQILLIILTTPYALCFATTSIGGLLQQAEALLYEKKDPNAAFSVLSQVYAQNPNAAGLSALIESCLRLRIESSKNAQDRFGLSALLVDQERYEEAFDELGKIVNSSEKDAPTPGLMERASSLLYRSKAAICDWETRSKDDNRLLSLLKLEERRASEDFSDVPTVHPFEALKWPCISLATATQIAQLYARRAILSQGLAYSLDIPIVPRHRSVVTLSSDQPTPKRPLRLGYLSPDFTAKHPLSFLMQHVFQHHDRQNFEVHIFSLASPQECPEVQAILQGVDYFSVLSPKQSSKDLAGHIREAGIDILIDLCGYTGTSRMAEILSHRPVPIQIAYMGFPASSGASYVDYMIVDNTVVPPSLRPDYTEGMIFLPHSYFVNSHATGDQSYAKDVQAGNRSSYSLPEDGMVFCCHSRSDKLDPDIFNLWVDTIVELRKDHDVPAYLWLLRSCATMERNLRQHARNRSLPDDALIFCDVVPRSQHLRRLAVADVFLDTPAYNAHTVGCDTLHVGTPMISLLLDGPEELSGTGKMASRVGASLLRAAGLEELVATSYSNYKSLMMKCALDRTWCMQIAAKLKRPQKSSLPLFDTKAWVGNLDRALLYLAANATTAGNDINVESIS